ncbi:MAG: DUF1987 domain-containing protein [Desulfomonile sp.]|nr:DUF1987 domain-containing protein [Desulfomonile sp.]
MDNLVVEATKSSPYISFDAGKGLLEIKGKSYPENAAKFYSPVFDWLNEYLDTVTDQAIQVNLEIIYFNSSSSKVFLNLFDMLDRAVKNGKKITIDWRYHTENDTARECGEEFMEELEAVKFNLVEIHEE